MTGTGPGGEHCTSRGPAVLSSDLCRCLPELDRSVSSLPASARFGVTPPDVVIELTDKKAWKSPKTLIQESVRDERVVFRLMSSPLTKPDFLLPLSPSQKALYFPNIAGHSLVQREIVHTTSLGSGKISLVSCLGTDTKTVRGQP